MNVENDTFLWYYFPMENKKLIIETAIGLQDVDSIKNSSYFLKEVNKYLDNKLSLDELEHKIISYYQKHHDDERGKEADIVATRIAQLLENKTFKFSINYLLSIHQYLFNGIYKHAGKIRTYNFYKNEEVLNGDTVIYGDYRELLMALNYDLEIEKQFDYSFLSSGLLVDHIASFIANLWQIHIFEEGNTRTTTVFLIKYLESLGFKIRSDAFVHNSKYYRNALVRANYRDDKHRIFEDKSFLVSFLKNLILNESIILDNNNLYIAK